MEERNSSFIEAKDNESRFYSVQYLSQTSFYIINGNLISTLQKISDCNLEIAAYPKLPHTLIPKTLQVILKTLGDLIVNNLYVDCLLYVLNHSTFILSTNPHLNTPKSAVFKECHSSGHSLSCGLKNS